MTTGPLLISMARVGTSAPFLSRPGSKFCLDEWLTAEKIEDGVVFRCVSRTGKVWGSGITEKVVWWMVRECAEKAGIERLAPHDLRRTCARLCHSAGGELEQIQFLLGHRSIETTERYLGSRQRLVHACQRQARDRARVWLVLSEVS